MILLRVSIWLKPDIETQYFLSRVLAKLILLKLLLHWTHSLSLQKKTEVLFLGVWWANRRVFCFGTLWYFYCFFFLSCYLITIPKHINDMEDFFSNPWWCFFFFIFFLSFFRSFFFDDDSTNAIYEKNKTKTNVKSVSWQPMVTCKHNMALCSLFYIKDEREGIAIGRSLRRFGK